jgi:hypothetical protein
MQAAPSPRSGLAGYRRREGKERGASRLSNRPDGPAREGAGLREPDDRPGDSLVADLVPTPSPLELTLSEAELSLALATIRGENGEKKPSPSTLAKEKNRKIPIYGGFRSG